MMSRKSIDIPDLSFIFPVDRCSKYAASYDFSSFLLSTC